eukprot:SAG11_NODE_716_length_7614_cov_63.924837_5_plen_96_part_00
MKACGTQRLLDARPDVEPLAAMEREHCAVESGFGASAAEFTTSNYGGNKTRPIDEWLHVYAPEKAPALCKGKDHNGRDLGDREKVNLSSANNERM